MRGQLTHGLGYLMEDLTGVLIEGHVESNVLVTRLHVQVERLFSVWALPILS